MDPDRLEKILDRLFPKSKEAAKLFGVSRRVQKKLLEDSDSDDDVIAAGSGSESGSGDRPPSGRVGSGSDSSRGTVASTSTQPISAIVEQRMADWRQFHPNVSPEVAKAEEIRIAGEVHDSQLENRLAAISAAPVPTDPQFQSALAATEAAYNAEPKIDAAEAERRIDEFLRARWNQLNPVQTPEEIAQVRREVTEREQQWALLEHLARLDQQERELAGKMQTAERLRYLARAQARSLQPEFMAIRARYPQFFTLPASLATADAPPTPSAPPAKSTTRSANAATAKSTPKPPQIQSPIAAAIPQYDAASHTAAADAAASMEPIWSPRGGTEFLRRPGLDVPEGHVTPSSKGIPLTHPGGVPFAPPAASSSTAKPAMRSAAKPTSKSPVVVKVPVLIPIKGATSKPRAPEEEVEDEPFESDAPADDDDDENVEVEAVESDAGGSDSELMYNVMDKTRAAVAEGKHISTSKKIRYLEKFLEAMEKGYGGDEKPVPKFQLRQDGSIWDMSKGGESTTNYFTSQLRVKQKIAALKAAKRSK